jgi:hypothetical protein
MDPLPDSAATTSLMTVIKQLGQTLGQELRRKMARILCKFPAIILVLAVGMTLTIAGVLRLSDALTLACRRWLGDPIMGDAVSGLAHILVPFVILLIIRSRLLR